MKKLDVLWIIERFGVEPDDSELDTAEHLVGDPCAYVATQLRRHGIDPDPLEDKIAAHVEATQRQLDAKPFESVAELEDALRRFSIAHAATARVALVATPSKNTRAAPGSCLGQVNIALPGEPWPHHEGRAMRGILQVRCQDLPRRPVALDGMSWLTMFIDDPLPFNTPSGDGWLLRTYPEGAAIVQVDPPTRHPSTAISWTPTPDMVEQAWAIQNHVDDGLFDRFQATLENHE